MEGEGLSIPPEAKQAVNLHEKIIDLSDQNIRPTHESWLEISPPIYNPEKPPVETSLFNEWLGEKGEESVSRDGVHLEDYGCGNGIKAGVIAKSLQEHKPSGYPVEYCTVIDSEQDTTEEAEIQIRKIAKPGLLRRQKITFHQVVGDFTKPLPDKNDTLKPQDSEQRMRLCLGNTVDNFKPEVVYPALANGLEQNDLLVIGLLKQDFDLPPELANQTIRDDSPELSQYPENFRKAIDQRMSSKDKLRYHKEDIFGLDKYHYDFHVSFDPERGWIHEIVVKGVDEKSTPDLYSKGLHNGDVIQLSNVRVQTIEQHIKDLEKYFTVVGKPLEDKNTAHTLFILRKATNNS